MSHIFSSNVYWTKKETLIGFDSLPFVGVWYMIHVWYMYGFVEVLGIKWCQNEIRISVPCVQSTIQWHRGQCCLWPKQVNEKKSFFQHFFFIRNVFCVLRDSQKFKSSKRTMIFSPATTIFLNCLYCCISGTHVINDCSNLVNKLF